MQRRQFIRYLTLAMASGVFSRQFSCQKKQQPNVLFIAVDDMNNWIRLLHPGS